MRTITKLMLALGVVGSLSLTSCKDYDEDNYNEIALTVDDRLAADAKAMAKMQEQITQLVARLDGINSCQCDGLSITKNPDGSYTITDKKNNATHIINQSQMQMDGAGSYFTDGSGNKVYIPNIVEENGKTYIQYGDIKYNIGENNKAIIPPTVSIEGDNITITSDGKTWTFNKTTGGGSCSCNIKLEWDATKNTYKISDGTNPAIEIPTGTYDFDAALTDNGDGTVTIKIGEESITLRKVVSDVSYDESTKTITIQKYNADGTKGVEQKVVIPNAYDDAKLAARVDSIVGIIVALYGEGRPSNDPAPESLAGRLKKAETTLTNVSGDVNTNKADIAAAKEDLADIEKALYGESRDPKNPDAGSIAARLNDLEQRIQKIEKSLAKLVTGIVVQDVVNPAFGSYSSLLTNVQTNMLVAYYGKCGNAIDFPTIDPNFGEKYNSGDLTMDGPKATAGNLYLTINPNTVNFTGLKLYLVNTKDEKCGINIENVRKTTAADDPLTFGFTRSVENNGLYVATATLPESAINDDKLKIKIDPAKYKQLISEALKVRAFSDVKPLMKDLLSVAVETSQALALEKQGVKCLWTDDFGEHSVYSKYEIAAVAQQPLGFNSVDEIFKEGGLYWRGYDKSKNLITSAAKKIGRFVAKNLRNQFNLSNIQADLTDISSKLNHIDEIKFDGDKVVIKSQVTIPSMEIKVGPFDVPYEGQSVDLSNKTITIPVPTPKEYDEEKGEWIMEDVMTTVPLTGVVIDIPGKNITVKEQIVHTPEQNVTVEVDITDDINRIMDGMLADVNQGFKDVNDLLDALDVALKDANDLLDNINKLEEKIENATYLPRLFNYLDKIGNAVGRYTPMLFKPVLLMNSDKGFGLVGVEGAPSTVSSTQVTLMPTTYSGELLTPILKKYIRVNGENGQIVNGKTVTVNLKKGINKIEYYALDYLCNEIGGEYYIEVK
ncbi:MAG: hypothetical protein Q4E63_04190 [Prevotellaceae bacterium]|nr:hypothetical protein [Prevotellaceae bacterium]